ncbi:MAG: Uma2 family endonuclease [Blastochloris sp.]|nr:Uma2 family endonuclease [Blastochloris sp.]
MSTKTAATIAQLTQCETKAEVVNGELVRLSPTGFVPGRASGEIYASLRAYERHHGTGYAIPDNVGFLVDLPHRQSCSPDAAWYVGPVTGMQFLDGAPAFAVEVRSEHDYGPAAERELAAKRRDYFAAGTLVVWDVDLLHADVVQVYRADRPDQPTIYRRGDLADAEPAVPGWTMPVDDLVPPEHDPT